MFRFSIRYLMVLTASVAVIAAICFYAFAFQSEVERDIRRHGSTPITDRSVLFAKVERLAEIGDEAQSATYVQPPDERPILTRVELAQVAHDYRDKYPLVSLRNRLAYESAGPKTKTKLTPATVKRMELAEDPTSGGVFKGRLTPVRTRALYALHSDWVFEFITQEGVGFSRMRFPSVWDLELDASPEVAIPPVRKDTPDPGPSVVIAADEPTSYDFQQQTEAKGLGDAFSAWSDTNNPLRIPTRNRLEDYHETDRLAFTESGRNGFARDIDHVAGFAPHQLENQREFDMDQSYGSFTAEQTEPDPYRWVLKSLQLVSLLKHDQPRVYVSKSLPSMEALPSATLRDLDHFEADGLKQLYDGDDVCIQGHENQVRMLGSLRATKQCLDCHTVDRGELLGAFSYEFVRSASLP